MNNYHKIITRSEYDRYSRDLLQHFRENIQSPNNGIPNAFITKVKNVKYAIGMLKQISEDIMC